MKPKEIIEAMQDIVDNDMLHDIKNNIDYEGEPDFDDGEFTEEVVA
jgi:hypothetical protein